MTEIICENNIYNAKLNGGGVSNSLNELFVCNPFAIHSSTFLIKMLIVVQWNSGPKYDKLFLYKLMFGLGI